MQVLKGKKKKMIEGREKPIWADVGFTLLIGDWQGKTTYTLVDERTGEKYSMFAYEKKEWSERPTPNDGADYGSQETVAVPKAEIPF